MSAPVENPKILTPTFEDKFWFGNLEISLKGSYVLGATAMPEMERPGGDIFLPHTPPPDIWRAWVVAVGPGIPIQRTSTTYNPGVSVGSYIYFLPHCGRFFDFHDISFVFVRMEDIDIVVVP